METLFISRENFFIEILGSINNTNQTNKSSVFLLCIELSNFNLTYQYRSWRGCWRRDSNRGPGPPSAPGSSRRPTSTALSASSQPPAASWRRRPRSPLWLGGRRGGGHWSGSCKYWGKFFSSRLIYFIFFTSGIYIYFCQPRREPDYWELSRLEINYYAPSRGLAGRP